MAEQTTRLRLTRRALAALDVSGFEEVRRYKDGTIHYRLTRAEAERLRQRAEGTAGYGDVIRALGHAVWVDPVPEKPTATNGSAPVDWGTSKVPSWPKPEPGDPVTLYAAEWQELDGGWTTIATDLPIRDALATVRRLRGEYAVPPETRIREMLEP